MQLLDSRSPQSQCQHIRAVSTGRIEAKRGNVGPALTLQIRQTLALILDITT